MHALPIDRSSRYHRSYLTEDPMRIVTWNVNSIRARLPRVLEFLERQKPDVVLLQELKCQDEQFPAEPIEEAGYNFQVFGQKTYNGVGILARHRIEDPFRGLQDEVEDAEARVIGATVGDTMFLNLYVVNGQEVGHPRFDYKLAWLDRVARLLERRYPKNEKVVLGGDWNITFDDRDVYAPEKWREKIHCSTAERAALARIVDLGYADAFRHFTAEGGHYTWWDFRTFGFKKNEGLRIDHFLMSEAALRTCSGVTVDLEARGGERPSDHAPLVAELG